MNTRYTRNCTYCTGVACHTRSTNDFAVSKANKIKQNENKTKHMKTIRIHCVPAKKEEK